MIERAWLVAYDIANPRRLGRVHRCMLRHAAAIEYSVFWLTGTPHARLRCLEAVLPLLDMKEDDLRIYAMPSRGLRIRLGPAVFPGGIEWSALPHALRWDQADPDAVARHGGKQ